MNHHICKNRKEEEAVLKIEKRDGQEVEFNHVKIKTAIERAMEETEKGLDEKLSEKIAKDIEKELEENHPQGITVEEIQDMVEDRLMTSPRKDVAKRYIIYRSE